jgi:four helix bundle protein
LKVFRQNEATGKLAVASSPVASALQLGSCSSVAVQLQLQFFPQVAASWIGGSAYFKGDLLISLGKSFGSRFAPQEGMNEPSEKRKRTLQLHERALRFSVDVNSCCPTTFSGVPARTVWGQLVRAADGASNNLIEADDAVSDADFLNKMGTALKEAKEARAELIKLRLGNLDNFQQAARLELEAESTQLCAIFATIIRNMESRLAREREEARRKKK